MLILLAVAGPNWALIGLFNVDLVATMFGPMTVLSRTVYVLVGMAGFNTLSLLPKLAR